MARIPGSGALALDDLSALHDEVHPAQRLQDVERARGGRDEVGPRTVPPSRAPFGREVYPERARSIPAERCHGKPDGCDLLSPLAKRSLTTVPPAWKRCERPVRLPGGRERLRAVDRALALFPGFPFAYFLAAMVHIARGALDAAEIVLTRGAKAQDAQEGRPARFPASGLHWLRGLVRAARGDRRGALDEFDRELAFETAGTI